MGDVVLSIDAELSWGHHDLERPPDRIADAREGWYGALQLLENYDVPATWAIVGHLMLADCDGRHADHPIGPSWFPCSDDAASSAGGFCAPDLIETVLSAEQDHEIASHSFSHVVMNGDEVTPAVAAAELSASRAAAERLGLELESFVFPRNRVDHRGALADAGFRCYRGTRPKQWYDDSTLRPLAKLADWSMPWSQPPIVTPTVDEHGLVDVPASLYLFSFEGGARRAAKRLGYRPIVAVAKRGIEAAAEADGVFHMWLHPHNLLQPDGVQRLDAILDYLDRRRAETDLTVRTMAEVAREAGE